MGALNLPTSGSVYVDANIAIYSVDRHPVYAPICDPIWLAAQHGDLQVVSSELILLEILVGPLRLGDSDLAARREAIWHRPGVELVPITREVLHEAARLRALHASVRTPDAIHVATALLRGCTLFVTNDASLARCAGLPMAVLGDYLSGP